MIRPAIELARTAPALDRDSDENIAELLSEVRVRFTGTTSGLSAGTQALLLFAVAADRLLADVDRDARDAALQVLDRLQAKAL